MNIEWSDRYKVNVQAIDEQHERFVGLINEMFEALEARQYSEKLDDLLDRVLKYAELHFKTEESLLENCGCPELQHQKNEHYKIMHGLNNLVSKRNRAKDDLAFYYEVINLLKNWLVHHMSSDDQLYAKHLREHGIS